MQIGDLVEDGGLKFLQKKILTFLIPLEELYVCKKFTGITVPIEFDVAFPDVKLGIPEEIAIMLDNTSGLDLVTLEYAAKLNQITEKIMGYSSD